MRSSSEHLSLGYIRGAAHGLEATPKGDEPRAFQPVDAAGEIGLTLAVDERNHEAAPRCRERGERRVRQRDDGAAQDGGKR